MAFAYITIDIFRLRLNIFSSTNLMDITNKVCSCQNTLVYISFIKKKYYVIREVSRYKTVDNVYQ